jgi:formate C-acetyltransferase
MEINLSCEQKEASKTIMASERIQRLKPIAYQLGRDGSKWHERGYLHRWAAYECRNEPDHQIRRAMEEAYVLGHVSLAVTEGELIVGRGSNGWPYGDWPPDPPEKHDMVPVASTGHRVLDYELLLTKGAKHILAQLDEKPETPFYRSVRISVEALVALARRFHDELLSAGHEDLAKLFEKMPYEPCTGFHEAVQCVWFVEFAMEMLCDTTLAGRPDFYLWPFYKKDLEAGVITRAFAEEIIQNWYLKFNEQHNTWPASLMVGGVDRNDMPVWNDITEICLDAIGEVDLINPSVSVCYTDDMPPHLLKKCVDLVAAGYTKPAIFNDRVVRDGLVRAGVTEEDARVYIHSTCVEITPIAASNIMVASPYINPTKALEYVLGKGKALLGEGCGLYEDIPLPESYDTFEQLFSTVKAAFAQCIRKGVMWGTSVAADNLVRKAAPLSSALINDCIATGIDAGKGGARYNFYYPCFPGYVTLVDSLAAIKQAVYKEQMLTLEELTELCRTDFADAEDVRLYLLNRCEKFGNGQADVDAIGKELYDFIDDELKKYTHTLGKCNTFHPSYFAWIQHGELGKWAAATPNGRRQSTALSESLGASQGCDHNSPLGVVSSISKLDQAKGIGGIATNFRFEKDFISGEQGQESLMNFIHTFMDSDCFECQFNVVDQKVLLAAREHPEDYSTLMVRVAGYSDYFTNLSRVIQDEVILRTEHAGV